VTTTWSLRGYSKDTRVHNFCLASLFTVELCHPVEMSYELALVKVHSTNFDLVTLAIVDRVSATPRTISDSDGVET